MKVVGMAVATHCQRNNNTSHSCLLKSKCRRGRCNPCPGFISCIFLLLAQTWSISLPLHLFWKSSGLNAISFKCLQYIHITPCFILFHFEQIFLPFGLLQGSSHIPFNSELQQIERGSRSLLPGPPPILDPSIVAIFAFFFFSYFAHCYLPAHIFTNGLSSQPYCPSLCSTVWKLSTHSGLPSYFREFLGFWRCKCRLSTMLE